MNASVPVGDPLELLTLADVAQLTKRSRRSVERDIAAGRLAVVKVGRSTRVRRSELERYLAALEAAFADPDATMTAPTPLRKGQS